MGRSNGARTRKRRSKGGIGSQADRQARDHVYQTSALRGEGGGQNMEGREKLRGFPIDRKDKGPKTLKNEQRSFEHGSQGKKRWNVS